MPRDDSVLDAQNEAVEEWLEFVGTEEMSVKVRDFIMQLGCKNGKPKTMHPVIKGGYNLVFRLEFDDDTSIVLRVPIKGEGDNLKLPALVGLDAHY